MWSRSKIFTGKRSRTCHLIKQSPVTTHPINCLTPYKRPIEQIGKTTDEVTIEDLAPTDEFQIGSRPATQHLLSQLDFSEGDHILDVGCGLGGAARYMATAYDTQVTGIDLTQSFVDVGTRVEFVGGHERSGHLTASQCAFTAL